MEKNLSPVEKEAMASAVELVFFDGPENGVSSGKEKAMSSSIKAMVATVLALGVGASVPAAAISYTGGTYTQDFDTLAMGGGSQTWANESTVPGWYAYYTPGGTWTAYTAYLPTAGGSSSEGLESLGLNNDSNRALGGRQWVENTHWGFSLVNNTGSAISAFELTYTGEQWRQQGTNPDNVRRTLTEYAVGATSHTGRIHRHPGLVI